MPEPVIALIAAVARNGVIGDGAHMPWNIRSELKYFMQTTRGKPVIMGRKTFESLGQPLKDRTNIIVTRDKTYAREGIVTVHSLEAAIAEAKRAAAETGAAEIMVCGGGEIYAQALPLAQRLYITEIDLTPKGDAKFPAFDRAAWTETKREARKALEGETADYTITVLEQRSYF